MWSGGPLSCPIDAEQTVPPQSNNQESAPTSRVSPSTITVLLVLGLVCYFLSLGPVIAIMDRFSPPPWVEGFVNIVYVPLEWVYDHCGDHIQRLFDSYIDWWYNLVN
jgi:hypothetical protein